MRSNRPIEARQNRRAEALMVAALVLGVAIGGAGLFVKEVLVPAFAKAAAPFAQVQQQLESR